MAGRGEVGRDVRLGKSNAAAVAVAGRTVSQTSVCSAISRARAPDRSEQHVALPMGPLEPVKGTVCLATPA